MRQSPRLAPPRSTSLPLCLSLSLSLSHTHTHTHPHTSRHPHRAVWSQDVCKGARFPVEGERCVVSSHFFRGWRLMMKKKMYGVAMQGRTRNRWVGVEPINSSATVIGFIYATIHSIEECNITLSRKGRGFPKKLEVFRINPQRTRELCEGRLA